MHIVAEHHQRRVTVMCAAHVELPWLIGCKQRANRVHMTEVASEMKCDTILEVATR